MDFPYKNENENYATPQQKAESTYADFFAANASSSVLDVPFAAARRLSENAFLNAYLPRLNAHRQSEDEEHQREIEEYEWEGDLEKTHPDYTLRHRVRSVVRRDLDQEPLWFERFGSAMTEEPRWVDEETPEAFQLTTPSTQSTTWKTDDQVALLPTDLFDQLKVTPSNARRLYERGVSSSSSSHDEGDDTKEPSSPLTVDERYSSDSQRGVDQENVAPPQKTSKSWIGALKTSKKRDSHSPLGNRAQTPLQRLLATQESNRLDLPRITLATHERTGIKSPIQNVADAKRFLTGMVSELRRTVCTTSGYWRINEGYGLVACGSPACAPRFYSNRSDSNTVLVRAEHSSSSSSALSRFVRQGFFLTSVAVIKRGEQKKIHEKIYSTVGKRVIIDADDGFDVCTVRQVTYFPFRVYDVPEIPFLNIRRVCEVSTKELTSQLERKYRLGECSFYSISDHRHAHSSRIRTAHRSGVNESASENGSRQSHGRPTRRASNRRQKDHHLCRLDALGNVQRLCRRAPRRPDWSKVQASKAARLCSAMQGRSPPFASLFRRQATVLVQRVNVFLHSSRSFTRKCSLTTYPSVATFSAQNVMSPMKMFRTDVVQKTARRE